MDDEILPGPWPLLAWLVAYAIALSAVWWAFTAHAQTADDETVLLLARTCVSERGWLTDTDDCAAIAEVARSRAERRGTTVADALRALAPRLHGSSPLPRREWLRHLSLDGSRPDALGAPWTSTVAALGRSRSEAWQLTLDAARGILDGRIPSPCSERPRAWGSTADLARRRARGYRWVAVDCGSTRNHYGRLYRPRHLE